MSDQPWDLLRGGRDLAHAHTHTHTHDGLGRGGDLGAGLELIVQGGDGVGVLRGCQTVGRGLKGVPGDGAPAPTEDRPRRR